MYLFFDSNYYIGLSNLADPLHQKVSKTAIRLQQSEYTPIISNFIFLEVVTVVSQRVDRENATTLGNLLKNTIEIVRIDKVLEEKTWDLFKKIKQKDVSFVDCSTLALLKEKRIEKLVTFDSQFKKFSKQFGFSVIS